MNPKNPPSFKVALSGSIIMSHGYYIFSLCPENRKHKLTIRFQGLLGKLQFCSSILGVLFHILGSFLFDALVHIICFLPSLVGKQCMFLWARNVVLLIFDRDENLI